MIDYAKTRNVKSPSRGRSRSAGIDFFIPEMNDKYLFDVAVINKKQLELDMLYIDNHKHVIIMSPGAHVLLPSGIKMNLEVDNGLLIDESGVAFIAMNRSSVASQHQLVAGATVADEDYQGELHISLINNSNRLIKLQPGQKVLQFIMTPVLLYDLNERPSENLFAKVSERGANGFGHTDDDNERSRLTK